VVIRLHHCVADGIALARVLLDLTDSVPFDVRPADAPLPAELGNRFGLVFARLPLDIEAPLERLAAVHAEMSAVKRSRQPAVSYATLQVMGLAPAVWAPCVGVSVCICSYGPHVRFRATPGSRGCTALAGSSWRADARIRTGDPFITSGAESS
jgi:hypothetical protein